jgi:hypothetical protein
MALAGRRPTLKWGNNSSGVQTERRGDAGLVWLLLGGETHRSAKTTKKRRERIALLVSAFSAAKITASSTEQGKGTT